MGTINQIGNKNAEKWTEEKTIKLTEDLTAWLSDKKDYKKNLFFTKFLVFEKGLNKSTIEYLGRKYNWFSEYIKNIRYMQSIKLSELGITGELNTAMTIFLSRTQHGHNENKTELYDFEQKGEKKYGTAYASDVTKLYLKMIDCQKKIVINRGGTRSSKTVSTVQIAIDWLMTGKLQDIKGAKLLTIVRKTLPSIKSSVLRDIKEEITKRGLDDIIEHHLTKKEFSYGGRTIEYFPTSNNEQKFRGSKRDILMMPEGNEVSWEDFIQLIIRGVKKVFIDFNPSDEYTWIKTQLEDKRAIEEGDVDVIVSNYQDNRFLSEGEIREIEILRKDPELWEIFGKGNYTKVTGLVYPNWKTYKTLPEEDFYVLYGCDFGYSNDPTAIIKLYIDKKKREVYTKEIMYETGKHSIHIIKAFEEYGYNKDEIICDNDPRMIDELIIGGLTASKAKKGVDSVVPGITLVKKYDVFLNDNDVNLRKEQKIYKYAKDPTSQGEKIYLNKPIKAFDHGMDAIRYGLEYFDRMYGHKYK